VKFKKLGFSAPLNLSASQHQADQTLQHSDQPTEETRENFDKETISPPTHIEQHSLTEQSSKPSATPDISLPPRCSSRTHRPPQRYGQNIYDK